MRSSCGIRFQFRVNCHLEMGISQAHLRVQHPPFRCYHHHLLLYTLVHRGPARSCTLGSSAHRRVPGRTKPRIDCWVWLPCTNRDSLMKLPYGLETSAKTLIHLHGLKRQCRLRNDTKGVPFLVSCTQILDSVMSSYCTTAGAMQQQAKGLCSCRRFEDPSSATNTEHLNKWLRKCW